MKAFWLVVTFILGILIGGFVSQWAVMYTLGSAVNECERANNVYLCKLVPTPVDPFHPEEN